MEKSMQYYIEDCLDELIDRAEEARKERDNDNTEFNQGRSLGYDEVLSFLIKQAEVFGIKEALKEKIKSFSSPL
jgi:hypothetical protein